jgi:hypothetical protein
VRASVSVCLYHAIDERQIEVATPCRDACFMSNCVDDDATAHESR